MNKIREAALTFSALCLAFCMGVVAWYAPGWSKILTRTLLNVNVFTEKGARAMDKLHDASKETADAAKNSNKASEEGLKRVQEAAVVIKDASKTLRSVRGQIDAVGNQATITLSTLNTTISSVNAQVPDTFAATRAALFSIPPAMQAGQGMFQSTRLLLDGPVAQSFTNFNNVLVPTAFFMQDVRTKTNQVLFPARRTGFVGKLQTGYQVFKVLDPMARPTYYGIRIVTGK